MQNQTETEAEAQAARLVTERLNKITKRAKYVRFRYRLTLIVIGVVTLLCIYLSPRLFVLFLPLDLVALHYTSIARSESMPSFDVDEIARLGGVKAIAPLFVALHSPLREKQEGLICDALTMLLPQMQASDAHLLTPAARRTMYKWLGSPENIIVQVSIPNAQLMAALKALKQVGDFTAIPVVEKLAQRKPRTPGDAEVIQTAKDCLLMLQARCGEVETARTLLRASHAEDARPDTLLRPSIGAGQADKDDLLRGTNAPEAPPSEGSA